MAPVAKTLLSYLPLAIFAAIMFWRLRNIQKARPLRLRTLWILPLIFMLLVGFVLSSMPPDLYGWLCIVAGLLIGCVVGWQRAKLMRLHIEGEGESARIMMRQSPAAILMIMAIAALRAIFRSATSTGQVVTAGHISAAGLYFTDALLGFALGMIVASRIELWRRAKALSSEHAAQPQ